MALSFLYLAFVRILQLLPLSRRDSGDEDASRPGDGSPGKSRRWRCVDDARPGVRTGGVQFGGEIPVTRNDCDARYRVGADNPVRALHLDFLRSQAEWQGGRWR